jgi:hypothetical protein
MKFYVAALLRLLISAAAAAQQAKLDGSPAPTFLPA